MQVSFALGVVVVLACCAFNVKFAKIELKNHTHFNGVNILFAHGLPFYIKLKSRCKLSPAMGKCLA